MSSTKTVGEQLTVLLRLQEIDKKIYGLMREKKEKPRELLALREKRDSQKGRVAALEKALTALQVKRKEKEIDLETKEGTVKKYQVQLYQIKTNKEYQSLQKEIETLKADNSVLEEEILKVMEEGDQKKGELEGEKKAFASAEETLIREEKRIAGEIEAIHGELSTLKEKRKGIIPEVERNLFERYDRVIAAKEGVALVPVEGNSCGGCHIHLPPQAINEVQLQEKVVVCENCSRILYDRSGTS